MDTEDMDREDLRRAAEECFLFAGIGWEETAELLADARPVAAVRGTPVYTPRHFSSSLGLIVSGQIAVTRGDVLVGYLAPGELFGASALFNDCTEYGPTLTARTDCRCLLMTQETVAQALARSPKMTENYIRYLSRNIAFLSGRLNALCGDGPEEKLRELLCRRADPNGLVTCSVTELARSLGLGRTSIYRALDQLERRGAIVKNGKSITLLTPEKFAHE